MRIDPDRVAMDAMKADMAPRIPWDQFLSSTLVWRQGEHMALIGPTGQGKTTLLAQLLPKHPYVVVFGTKPRDETMDYFIHTGYHPMERWISLSAKQYPRRVLWPNATRLNSVPLQKTVFADALNRIFREGGWTVVIDELWYIVNTLNLGSLIKLYLLQARALKISLVCATQRPAFVPLEVYDQSTHLFFFRDNDETNLRRLSGISWRSADLIMRLIADLDQHQVLYINTRTGFMCRTRCPKLNTDKYKEKGVSKKPWYSRLLSI